MNVLIIGRNWGRVFVNPFLDRRHNVTVSVAGSVDRLSWADIVVVATPPRYHCDLVVEALRCGCHILCEKPFGLTVAEAEQMRFAADMDGIVAAVNYEFRYEEALQNIKKRGGRIIGVSWTVPPLQDGRERSWRGSAAEGGGLWNEFGSHVLDYLHWTSSEDATITLDRSVEVGHDLLVNGHLVELYRAGGIDTRPACVDRLVGEFLDAIDGKPAPSLPTFADGVYVRQQLEKRL